MELRQSGEMLKSYRYKSLFGEIEKSALLWDNNYEKEALQMPETRAPELIYDQVGVKGFTYEVFPADMSSLYLTFALINLAFSSATQNCL